MVPFPEGLILIDASGGKGGNGGTGGNGTLDINSKFLSPLMCLNIPCMMLKFACARWI